MQDLLLRARNEKGEMQNGLIPKGYRCLHVTKIQSRQGAAKTYATLPV